MIDYSQRFRIVLLLVGIFQTCVALQGWPQSSTIVDGNAVQFERGVWESMFANPNATGNYSVKGFDVSQTWPGKEVDGWKLSIKVTSDIPDSQKMGDKEPTGKTFTGTSLYLTAPEAIRSNLLSQDNAVNDTTWKICVTVMMNGPEEGLSTGDNGTCNFISAQCSSDFEKVYADKFKQKQECYSPPSMPASCGNSINKANLTTMQFPIDYLGGREILVTASDLHNAGDSEAFSIAVKRVWPVLITWGWNKRANASGDAVATTQFTCARANNVAPGSNNPSSTGDMLRSSRLAVLGYTCAALFANWLI